MALYGSLKDVAMFTGIAHEIIDDVVTQQIGYYKVMLADSTPNVYGESLTKSYIGPVLLNCLIVRGEYTTVSEDFGPDRKRAVSFSFLKGSLVQANVIPEIGDVIMYNELYYEADNLNENQLVLGKDSNYAYSEGLEGFGNSFSITIDTHMTTPERLGIKQFRL